MQSTESTEYIDLQQYWLIFKRRLLPASAVLGFVLLLTALITFWQKPIYQAQGKLLLKRSDTSSLTGLGKELGQIDALANSPDSNIPANTQAEIISSAAFAQKVMTELNLKNEQGEPLKLKEFQNRLEVQNTKGTDVIQISYKSTVPEEARAVVNQLMNLYVQHNIFTNRSQAVAAREFIAAQLPKSKANVQQAEAELREFKEQNKILDLENEAKSAVTVISDLESQIGKAQVALANANSRSTALQKEMGMNAQQATVVNSLSQSPGVQKALTDLQELESQLAVERNRFQENSPVIENLKSKEASLKAVLQERMQGVVGDRQQLNDNLQIGELQQKLTEEFVKSEVERVVLTNQLTALNNVYSSYQQRANVIPQLQQRQQDLARDVEAARSTYETLLQKFQEVRITENQNVGNAQIVDTGRVLEAPVAPRKLLNFGVGGIIGVLLAGFTALALDARDSSVKTVREARELLGYTLLGIIPNFEKIDKAGSRTRNLKQAVTKIPVKDTPRSTISETYGMLYANLKFLSSDQEVRVITITSAVPKEGKSTVSANLALAIAQLGFRVLLVDADMRRPSQHEFWERSNAVGLSNVIVGQTDLKRAIAQVMPNLYLLTAGVIPPNPLALLNSKRMASLVEVFSQSYDFVILDTPPLNAAADARILGVMTDGILMVVQPQLVDSASAISAKELLEHSGGNILGMVVNGLNPENEPDSYFYAKEYHSEQDLTAVNDSFKVGQEINRF
ncbi:polysaccharide biosynthesis tyrosine autokinase [Chroococcidiopsis sp. CCMEE 29]|uniref:GumC family protein n=1 Tax=Chroococcidiopsis sp. CCMEE 29 TaxID=155894 RepID=UPI002020C34E|nr:polysaccharide biosynthesis tyrosine autokinase [Chroococcidiopsis sp. CCMEE 29]